MDEADELTVEVAALPKTKKSPVADALLPRNKKLSCRIMRPPTQSRIRNIHIKSIKATTGCIRRHKPLINPHILDIRRDLKALEVGEIPGKIGTVEICRDGIVCVFDLDVQEGGAHGPGYVVGCAGCDGVPCQGPDKGAIEGLGGT